MNGRLVATHEGGHTPICADITEALRQDTDQVVVVRAEDQPEDLAQPRGKQDWRPEPHDIWYHRTTGIWQPVWLEQVGRAHLADIRWTPDLARGLVGLSVRLERHTDEPLDLRIRLSIHGQPLVDDVCRIRGVTLHRELALDAAVMPMERKRLLWSPDHPNLVDATLTLSVGDAEIDRVESYLGLRSVGVGAGRFLLNGRPYFMRMVLEQGYWPESHLAAPDAAALRREVELIKACGFNGVRIHQKVEDPRFLYWCDQLGLLVWGEMANAYTFSPTATGRFVREWLDVLARDYSHPSIVCWVPLNESWGVPNLPLDAAQQAFAQAVYYLTKASDPTRPALSNDGWEYLVGDICGVHDYSFEGEALRDRYATPEAVSRTLREVQPQHRSVLLSGHRREAEPVMVTEYGGLSLQPDPEARWHGYGALADAGALLDRYRELTTALLDSTGIAGFCYTQLTDTGQETNGLLTEHREFKIDPAAVRAITTRVAAAVPGDLTIEQQRNRGITPFAAATVETQTQT